MTDVISVYFVKDIQHPTVLEKENFSDMTVCRDLVVVVKEIDL